MALTNKLYDQYVAYTLHMGYRGEKQTRLSTAIVISYNAPPRRPRPEELEPHRSLVIEKR